MPLNHRLHCPCNSLMWLWNINGQNTLWVPLVIIPYHSPQCGWWAEPLRGLAQSACEWWLPWGQIVLQSETRREPGAQRARGLGPSICRCWRLRRRVLIGGQRWKPSPITGSDTGITGMALVLSLWLHTLSILACQNGHTKPQCLSPVSTQHPTGQTPKLALRTLGGLRTEWTLRSKGEIFPRKQFAFPLS